MKFSIIIPIYGVEPYLVHCLESVACQTYKDIEVIMVDDGSKDNCPAICDAYVNKDDRFKVIHKINGGLVSARQAGAKVATGDYVVCLDGDDWIGPNYISSFAEEALKNNPDTIICGSTYVFSKKKEIHKSTLETGFYVRDRIERVIFPQLIMTKNGTGLNATVWAKAYKTSLYKRIQLSIDPSIKMGEDRACSLPIIYHSNSLAVIDCCEYYYRSVESSMTHNLKPRYKWGPRLLHVHLWDLIDTNNKDFCQQIYRGTTKGVFSVAISLFYAPGSYLEHKLSIIDLLKDKIYAESINNVSFSGPARIMSFTLKYKLIPVLWICSVLKRIRMKFQ